MALKAILDISKINNTAYIIKKARLICCYPVSKNASAAQSSPPALPFDHADLNWDGVRNHVGTEVAVSLGRLDSSLRVARP